MRRTALRVAAFAVITLSLTWLWEEGGRLLYGKLLKLVAPSIYDLLGFEGARVGAFRQRYVNFVPFIGLVLVTPRLSARRRVLGLLAGLLLLFGGHLALNLTEVGQGRARHLPLVPSLVSDTLPFLLWLMVAAPALAQGWLAPTGPTEPAPASAAPTGIAATPPSSPPSTASAETEATPNGDASVTADAALVATAATAAQGHASDAVTAPAPSEDEEDPLAR